MRRIPLALKIAYTPFLAVLLPYYWATYTPWNFLYFCDIALLLTCVGLWTEKPLLISMPAVGILLPQALWLADLGARAITGSHITGMTAYMFDPRLPVFVRALSSFHGWLPIVLVYAVLRLGYDRRAFLPQAALTITLLIFCYAVGPDASALAAHPQQAVNVNYVFGLDDHQAQSWMSPLLWLALLMVVYVVVFCAPTHLLLKRFAPPRMR